MSRRSQLEHEVYVAQERIKKAAKDTPKDIIKLWEQVRKVGSGILSVILRLRTAIRSVFN